VDLVTLAGALGVLVTLILVLVPNKQVLTRQEFELQKVTCMNNVRHFVGLLEMENERGSYPAYSGPNLLLYFVRKGELEGEDALDLLFCPGDEKESLDQVGGVEAYRNLDLTERRYGAYTSYACRDLRAPRCAVNRRARNAVVLLCDDSADHHGGKGFVVGLSGGAVKWRDKVDDWGLDPDTRVRVGEGSVVPELRCLRAE